MRVINKRLHDKAKKMCYNSIIEKEQEVRSGTREPPSLGSCDWKARGWAQGIMFGYFGKCVHGGARARMYN